MENDDSKQKAMNDEELVRVKKFEKEQEDQERDLERQDEIEEERDLFEMKKLKQEQEDQERDLERQEELDEEYGDSYECMKLFLL